MSNGSASDLYIPDFVPASDRKYIENQQRFGNRVGWGDNPAVLIVDMTVSFIEETVNGRDCVESTSELLESARDADKPVFYTVPDDSTKYPDGYPVTVKAAAGSDRGPNLTMTDKHREFLEKIDHIPAEIEPRDDEVVVKKPRASAFFDTHLSNLLHYQDIDTLIVAGMVTNACVRATVVDSHSSNFRTVVPVECVADTLTVSNEISLFDMDLRYADVTPLETVTDELESRA